MLAMIHDMRWLQRPAPLLFNSGCEEAFAESDFDHHAVFVDEPLEYLRTRTPTRVSEFQAELS